MIPAQAVEAAAKGLAVQAWGEWEYVPDELRRLFLRDAKIALEAAAPYMHTTINQENTMTESDTRTARDEFAEAIATADRAHKDDPVDPTIHYSYVIADELIAMGYGKTAL